MIQLIIGLALLGFILWAILKYIPMPDIIQKLILIIVVICVIWYVAGMFGFTDIPLPGHRR